MTATDDTSDADRIYLLVKDPRWTFIWWRVSSQSVAPHRHAASASDSATLLCVRVYDVTVILFDGSNAHATHDLIVPSEAGEWYFQVPADGRVYCAEFGVKGRDGTFHPIVRSEAVLVPCAGPTDVGEETWTTLELPPPSGVP